MDKGWASMRWFVEESIALAASPTKAAQPTPSHDDTAEERARRIIEVVAAYNPIEKRAA